jgi:hypothetical protein
LPFFRPSLCFLLSWSSNIHSSGASPSRAGAR